MLVASSPTPGLPPPIAWLEAKSPPVRESIRELVSAHGKGPRSDQQFLRRDAAHG